ncbi:hypothetical protein [Vreelandella titanicae]|nr:hypothetical protein [Halomonas titanicae]
MGDVAHGALVFDRGPVVGFGEPSGLALGVADCIGVPRASVT